MVQVEVAVQHGLDGVGPRPELIEAVEGEEGRAVVEGRDGAGLEPVDVAAQHRGRIQAGLADREAGLACPGGGQDDHQPSPERPGRRGGLAGDRACAETHLESQGAGPASRRLVGMEHYAHR